MVLKLRFNDQSERDRFIRNVKEYPGVAVSIERNLNNNTECVKLASVNAAGSEFLRRLGVKYESKTI